MKLLRYAPIALTAAVAFGVYWNFESLRGIRVSFAPLRSMFGSDAVARGNEATRFGGELKTESIEAPVVVGTDPLTDAALRSPP